MRYADITTCDIANGSGIGVVLWCQGCSLDCPGCQNKCTHAVAEGRVYSVNVVGPPLSENLHRLVSLIQSGEMQVCYGIKRRKTSLLSAEFYVYGITFRLIGNNDYAQYGKKSKEEVHKGGKQESENRCMLRYEQADQGYRM